MKEFQVTVIKMLMGLERRVDELSKNYSRDKKDGKNQSELKNALTEIKLQ